MLRVCGPGPVQEVRAESGRRIAKKREEFDLGTLAVEIGVGFDVVAGDAAEISIESADAVQVGRLDECALVASITSTFGERQSDIAMTRRQTNVAEWRSGSCRRFSRCARMRTSGVPRCYCHRESPVHAEHIGFVAAGRRARRFREERIGTIDLALADTRESGTIRSKSRKSD